MNEDFQQIKMLCKTTEQLLKRSKYISQNMPKAPYSRKSLINIDKSALEIELQPLKLLKTSLNFRKSTTCLSVRQFSRTSSLNHDIKCVTTSYYEDLGILSTATSKEIKDAFYKLSKECHPDKVGADNQEALLQFQAISEAYSILGDPKLRRQYDRGVLGKMR